MKRLLVIAACGVLFSINAVASLIPTQDGQVVTKLVFSVPAGESAHDSVTVFYEVVGGTVMEDFTISGLPSWLTVAPVPPATKFTTPAEVLIWVDTAGLSEGSIPGATLQFVAFSSVLGTLDIDLTVTAALPRTAGVSPEVSSLTVAANQIGTFVFNVLSALLLQSTSSEGIGTGPSAIGEVNWTASVKLLSEPGSDWLTISPTSGTATPDNPSQVTGTVDAAKLPGPGTYQAEIAVTSNPTVTLPVTVVVRPPGPRLSVSQTAILFQSVSSGPFTISETVTISNEGDGTLNWSLSGLPSWLTAEPDSGSVTSGPAGEDVVLTADPSSFGSGINSALLTVSAPEASNNPQVVAAVLLTVPGATPATAEVSPNALVFVVEQGQPTPPTRTVAVSNVGGGSLSFNFSATITPLRAAVGSS